MKLIRFISRIFVGLIFVFSGFVKAVDPLGSAYKFTDYFEAFGMEWATGLAFALGVLLYTAEFLIGMSLIFGVKLKLASIGALIFMVIFTPLTLVLAISNPVTDCGCFGDALKLTNWQTFGKNIIILIPTLILFAGRKKFIEKASGFKQFIQIAAFIIIVLGFSIYNYSHLPVIDFRPYKVGKSIPDGMVVPESEQNNVDVYEILYQYKNKATGEEKTFDSNSDEFKTLNFDEWEYVDRSEKLLKKGYEPPIHDFTISNDEEGEITDLVLSDENYSFLLVAYNLKKTSLDGFKTAYKIAEFAKEKGLKFYCLTSASQEDIDSLKSGLAAELQIEETEPSFNMVTETLYYYELDGEVQEFTADALPDEEEGWMLIDQVEQQIPEEVEGSNSGFAIPFYTSDEVTLKTIVRANPGLLLLKKGVIVGKWHYNDFPELEEFENEILK